MALRRHPPSPLALGLAVLTTALLAWSWPKAVAAADDTLRESEELLRQFPFQPNCNGNIQEMVACLWLQRNQDDAALRQLLAQPELLERWRASRRLTCEIAAEKAKGGSVHPLVWLGCENSLNKELLRQIRRPLLQNADL